MPQMGTKNAAKSDSTKLAKLGIPTKKTYTSKETGKTTNVKTKILAKK